jgi:hypothetical protein
MPVLPGYLDSGRDQDEVSLPNFTDFGFDRCRNQQLHRHRINLKLSHSGV